MKKLYSLIISLLVYMAGNSQAPSFQWVARYGGTGDQIGRSIQTDAAGNIYATGYFDGVSNFDTVTGSWTFTATGVDDIFITKTNPAGTTIWARRIGSTSGHAGYSIALDKDGFVYVSGTFQGTLDFDPGPGIFNLTSAGISDGFVLKLTSDGNFIWARSFGGTGIDISLSVKIDPATNVYIAGSFSGTGEFDPGPGIAFLTAAGSYDGYILKLDSAGKFIWVKRLGGTMNEQLYGLSTDASGNVYTCGTFLGTADFDPGAASFNLTATGTPDMFISKLDSSGKFAWAKNVAQAYAYCVAVDGSGNVFITGSFQATTDFDPGTGVSNFTPVGGGDVFVLKLSPSGSYQWAKGFGSLTSDVGQSIAFDPSGNLYLCGTFTGTADLDPDPAVFNVTSAGSVDIFISKLDTAGKLISAVSFGGTFSDYAFSIYLDQSQNIYTIGYFSGTVDFDPGAGTKNIGSIDKNDAFIHKMSQSASGIINSNSSSEINVYPNPTQGIFTIDLMKAGNYVVEVFDMSGKNIYENNSFGNEIKINLNDYSDGIYFLKITNEDKFILVQRIIKQSN